MEYKTYVCDGINYMIPLSLPPDYPIYEVSVSELDMLWKQAAKETYIGKNKGDPEKRFNVACALGINEHYPIEMPEIRVDDPDRVCFIDGRHRFSRVREMHNEKILIVVSKNSSGDIEKILSSKRIN